MFSDEKVQPSGIVLFEECGRVCTACVKSVSVQPFDGGGLRCAFKIGR